MKGKESAIGYSRVSTEEQSEHGISLEEQQHRIASYHTAREVPWKITQISEQGSAKDLHRKELQRIILGIKDGWVKCVIVYRLDRLTRSIHDMDVLMDPFQKYRVQFLRVKENIDTETATGRLFIRLVVLFAQWERETVTERTTDTMMGKWKREGGVFSRPPFGYQLVKKKVDGKLKAVELKPDPKTAPMVKEMYEMILRTYNLSALAKHFGLSRSTVKRILMNEAYLGKAAFKGFIREQNHPAIVTPEQYKKVQQVLKLR